MSAAKKKGLAKNGLRHKKEIADLCSLIVLDLKDEYKNLDISELRKSHDLVHQVMEKIEEAVVSKQISKETLKKIDKNDLVIQIFQGLFPDLSDDDCNSIKNTIEFVINNKLLKNPNFFLKSLNSLLKFVLKLIK